MARAMYVLIILHICNDETCKPNACMSTCVRLIKKLALSFMIKTSVRLDCFVKTVSYSQSLQYVAGISQWTVRPNRSLHLPGLECDADQLILQKNLRQTNSVQNHTDEAIKRDIFSKHGKRWRGWHCSLVLRPPDFGEESLHSWSQRLLSR